MGITNQLIAVAVSQIANSQHHCLVTDHINTRATPHAAAVLVDAWTACGVQVSTGKLAVQESRHKSKMG